MTSKRKLIRVVVTLLLLFSLTTPTIAEAYTSRSTSDSYVKQVVNSKLKTLTRQRSGYADDRGVLYYLSSLLSLSMWNYEANFETSLKLNASVLKPYQQSLDSSRDDFNKRYKNGESKFTPAAIDFSVDLSAYSESEGLQRYADKAFSTILDTSASEATTILEALIKDFPTTGDDEAKRSYLDGHALTIRAVYNLLERSGQERQTLLALFNSTSGDYLNITKLTKLLNESKYKPIFDYAQNLIEKNIMSQTDIKLTDDNNDLNKFLTNKSGVEQVNQAYLACISSSSIYRPFSSKTGEDSFISALEGIVGTNANGQDIVKTYNRIKDKVKPLYYRAIDSSGNGTGVSKRITVADFFKMIEDDSSGGLVTFNGKFTRQEDGDSYAFETGKGKLEYTDNGEVASTPTPKTSTSTASSTATTTSSKGGAVLSDGEGQTVTLSDTIESTDLVTDFIFKFGKDSPKSVMGKVLMWNILKDYKTDKLDSEYDKQLLYVDTFGDVVLGDHTVVIPAASNPCILNDKVAYNPNTASFMNSYPKSSLISSDFSINDRDSSKYIITMEQKTHDKVMVSAFGEDTDIYKDFGQNENGPTVMCDIPSYAYILSDNKTAIKTTTLSITPMPLEMTLFDDGSEKVQTIKAIKYKFKESSILSGAKGAFSNERTEIEYTMMPDSNRMMPFGTPKALFPLTDNSDPSFNEVCAYLGGKYFDDITMGKDGTRVDGNDRINVKLMTDMFKCEFNGTANTATLIKNIKEEYSDLTELNTVNKILSSLAQKVLDTVGGVSGVIGMRNAYQDGIWGTILNYTRKFMPFILIIVIVYFLTNFIRKRCNFISSMAFITLGLGVAYVSTQVLPIYMPVFLNGAISAFSDEVCYKSLFMRQEQYINPYNIRAGYSDTGNFSYSKSSINLYRFHDADLVNVANRYNTTEENLKSGKAVVLDDNSGLFIEGDILKMNLDRMFNGLIIQGSYSSNGVGNIYTLKSTKKVSNCLDYYTPYYLVVDGFLDKLNKMSDVFNIPPSQLSYGKNLYKDSFMVSSYARSDLFLNRGDLTKIDENNNFDSSLSQTIIDTFGENNVDWLGIQSVVAGGEFKQNLDSIKDTLWFKTMVKNGYYDADGNIIDSNRLAKVIDHVNNTTQQLIIDNKGQLSFLSDENMIKIISLYAMIDFNLCISDYNSVVYPQALNYEEQTLQDVLLPVLTKDYDRYIAQDRNIVDYVAMDFGTIGLIMFILDTLLAFLITSCMRLAIPVLYLFLIFAILARLSMKNERSITAIINGFLQIAGSVLLCYVAFCYLTSTLYKISDSAFCLFLLFIIYLIIATILFSVLLTFVTKLGDFSEIRVRSTLGDIASKFPGVKQLTATIGKAINKAKDTRDAKLGRDSEFDARKTFNYSNDIYNEKVLSDVMKMRHNFESYSPPDGKKSKKRLKLKSKGVQKDYNYSEEDSIDRFKL